MSFRKNIILFFNIFFVEKKTILPNIILFEIQKYHYITYSYHRTIHALFIGKSLVA